MADSPESQSAPRPSIKIRTPLPGANPTATMSDAPAPTSSTAMSPPPITPSTGGGLTPTIAPKKSIIKITAKRSPSISVPPVPILPGPAPAPPPDAIQAAPTLTKTAKGRISKPSAKKRAKSEIDMPEYGSPEAGRRTSIKIKKLGGSSIVKTGGTKLVLAPRGTGIPVRHKGEGYDSAEEDPKERERDPVIEEQIVIRFMPGEHLEYVRKMVEERKIGVPIREGGAEFSVKWLSGVERRASVMIKGALFAAVLVDLPTITESMKTWDKKNFMKSADVCQMLLVFARVKSEEEARVVELPKMVNKEFRWPHGLTPPMHDCVHRRFRKRLSKKEIKDKEAELKRLLEEDRGAMETSYEFVDDGADRPPVAGQPAGVEEVDEEQDAEGEFDDMGDGEEQDELEAMINLDDDDDDGDDEGDVVMGETPAAVSGETPVTGDGETPAVRSEEVSDGSGEEGFESDEDEDDDDDDDDDDGDERRGIRKDISDLKKQLQAAQANLATTTNMLLRRRIDENIKKIKEELRLKQANIGEAEDDEDF